MDADDRPVLDGMVVGGDRRMALRVVPHVHEQLVRVGGHAHPVEQLRRGRALLHDAWRSVSAGRAVRVADGVGAALGDRGQQCLRGQRPLDARSGREGYIRLCHT